MPRTAWSFCSRTHYRNQDRTCARSPMPPTCFRAATWDAWHVTGASLRRGRRRRAARTASATLAARRRAPGASHRRSHRRQGRYPPGGLHRLFPVGRRTRQPSLFEQERLTTPNSDALASRLAWRLRGEGCRQPVFSSDHRAGCGDPSGEHFWCQAGGGANRAAGSKYPPDHCKFYDQRQDCIQL